MALRRPIAMGVGIAPETGPTQHGRLVALGGCAKTRAPTERSAGIRTRSRKLKGTG
jgi:hypothetical protein